MVRDRSIFSSLEKANIQRIACEYFRRMIVSLRSFFTWSVHSGRYKRRIHLLLGPSDEDGTAFGWETLETIRCEKGELWTDFFGGSIGFRRSREPSAASADAKEEPGMNLTDLSLSVIQMPLFLRQQNTHNLTMKTRIVHGEFKHSCLSVFSQ